MSAARPTARQMARAADLAARLITRSEAAAYCGYSAKRFSELVRAGIMPGPVAGTRRWDRKAIDAALDRASGLASNANLSPLEAWKARKHAHVA